MDYVYCAERTEYQPYVLRSVCEALLTWMDDDSMKYRPVESSTIDGFTLTESQNQDYINRVVVVDCWL